MHEMFSASVRALLKAKLSTCYSVDINQFIFKWQARGERRNAVWLNQHLESDDALSYAFINVFVV